MGAIRRRRSRGSVVRTAGLAAGTGAAGAYFFDPDNGNRRRSVARDRIAAVARRAGRKTANAAETSATIVANKTKGMAWEAKRAAQPERPAANDQALTDRVKSQILRAPDSPKGSVNINVEDGIVYLRGELDGERSKALVDAARSVEGVRGVEDLLHRPGEPPAHKVETAEETRRRVLD
jgi:hypothetical protein